MRNQTNGDLTKQLARTMAALARTMAALALGWTLLGSKGYPALPASPQEPSPTHPLDPAPVTPAPPGSVEPIVSMRDRAPSASPVAPHGKNYSIQVPAGDWVDTGVTLTAGERVAFQVSGNVAFADHRAVTADGLDRGWKDLLRQFPLNSAKTGALIGRVSDMGASVPFAIGSSATLTMPTSGRLYLRSNLTDDLNGSGSFTAKISFPGDSAAPVANQASHSALSPNGALTSSPLGSGVTSTASTAAPSASVAAVSTVVTPSLFADVPRRVGDEAGDPGDMVNFALIGSEDQVRSAFKSAGWVAVDKSVGDALLHGLLSTLNHEAYTEMPMSTLYLFGRPQDLSFARGDPLTVAAERHHLRVWKSPETVGGQPLWVGSATHDIGFEKDQRNGKTTHKIDPDIDAERQFLLDSFDAAGVFSSAAYITPSNPLREARTATGGSFHSDGRIVVMQLK